MYGDGFCDYSDKPYRAADLAAAEPRPKVVRFARLIERELRANDRKGNWLDKTAAVHIADLDVHVAKLKYALATGDGLRIEEHAADVATIAMFVADVRGVL